MSKYADYDYLDIYNSEVLGEETDEDKINELRSSKRKYKHVLKTIQSGSMLEAEVYPVYERKKDIPRREKVNDSNESQSNLNDKNARKKFVRLVNHNFGKDDLLITLTYQDKYLPTEKQAKRDMQNYIRRIKAYLKKHSLPDLKYIYVIEYVDEEEQHKSKKIRVHHHLIINQMDRNVVEDLWGRGRVEARRLQPDDFGLEGIARYMLKDPRGKRWYGSRNLKPPVVNRAVTKLTNRKAENMARRPDELKGIFESIYKGRYQFLDYNILFSDFTGGFYIYCRMRKNE